MASPTVTNKNQEYIIFSLHGHGLAVDLTKVEEIILPVDVKPFPMSPRPVKGVFKCRDAIYTLIDLSFFLNIKAIHTGNANEPRIIVLKSHETTVGITVDQINEIKTALKDDSPLSEEDSLNPQLFPEQIKTDSASIPVLDVEQLVASLKVEAEKLSEF
ncbi:chemotaxis signal transduction protein [Pullulanibacillus pueri]|uniref:CheW-like domain-containing protein n=1 Tax=Pullulanibacillus pueri TaxID=1437324 RepID=A0A8J2ZVY3_9BACL|nr:chemotaxis protein CheW [Pullulanibacillus pueri]MBM7682185.1 chemotaxis signal transduction protein [Pullulanibacillus pueri]GGH80366.1 hypothetical protein GCM10007096_16660 [Pullulanibacillus pueri]